MDKEPKMPERWHGAHHYSNKLNIFLVFFLIFAALSFLWFYLEINKLESIAGKIKPTPTTAAETSPSPAEGVVCTMEAKLCPDGVTYVGRSGPKCEFAPCPTSIPSSNTGSTSNSPTCIPRPKCLDATPRCYIAETENMCPKTISP